VSGFLDFTLRSPLVLFSLSVIIRGVPSICLVPAFVSIKGTHQSGWFSSAPLLVSPSFLFGFPLFCPPLSGCLHPWFSLDRPVSFALAFDFCSKIILDAFSPFSPLSPEHMEWLNPALLPYFRLHFESFFFFTAHPGPFLPHLCFSTGFRARR